MARKLLALFALSPADLDTNRQGRLSEMQRRAIHTLEMIYRVHRVLGALFFAGLEVLVLTQPWAPGDVWLRPPIAAFLAGFAVMLLFWGTLFGDSLASDLRLGRVFAVDGRVRKWVRQANGQRSAILKYYLAVGRFSFEITPQGYRKVPEDGRFRLYFLPRSRQVVNLEELPEIAGEPGAGPDGSEDEFELQVIDPAALAPVPIPIDSDVDRTPRSGR
jgi:hypothetical protein